MKDTQSLAFTDQQWMQLALQEAQKAVMISPPNPSVGCVIVKDGQLIGKGHTQQVGGPHAEVMAMRDAFESGHDLDMQGATAYVTLEPCSHFGRTPPCADALVKARLGRVVVATLDPNPQVSGHGIQKLQQAGIEVTVGVCEQEALFINAGFLCRMEHHRPYVRLKVASTLDGKTAFLDKRSNWITGPAAREHARHWRARSGALVTGIGTVLADDPQMTARLPDHPREPIRVIVDAKMDIPLNAKILKGEGQVIVVTGQVNEEKAQRLKELGVLVWNCPQKNAPDRVDLREMLVKLANYPVNDIMLEAGCGLNTSFLKEDLVDEIILYQAPCFFGEGMPIANFTVPDSPGSAPRWRIIQSVCIGNDQCLHLGRPE